MSVQPISCGSSVDVMEMPWGGTLNSQDWVTIVWDDPVNLMSYVSYVFQEYFKFSAEKAERLMLQVHTEGKAVVSMGNREAMERDVMAMQNYSLWATMERA